MPLNGPSCSDRDCWQLRPARNCLAGCQGAASVCARLAAEFCLPLSGLAGPRSVMTAATGGQQGLVPLVPIHLGMGDVLREFLSISPMDMDVNANLIMDWDWVFSHNLRYFFRGGEVDLRSGAPLCKGTRHAHFLPPSRP